MRRTDVLIVDDDPVINQLLLTGLENQGWELFSVLDGQEAIKFVDENLLDLVLLDLNLPKISGLEVCRYITARYSIPVIVLSARSDLNCKVSCLDMGAEDYITKPFLIEPPFFNGR